MAAAGKRVERIGILRLPDREMESGGQTLEDTEGRTPVRDLTRRQVDVVGRDHGRLGRVAESVASSIEGGQWLRLSRPEVSRLLPRAVGDGRVERTRLQEKVRAAVSGAAES